MNLDNGTRGATTPWRGRAHYRDLGRLLFEAVAAGLIGSLALALAVLIATTTARATELETVPHASPEVPATITTGVRP